MSSDSTSTMIQQKQAVVVLNNDTGGNYGTAKLDRFKNWSGGPRGGAFPTTISASGGVKFTHLPGTAHGHGSMAAVQYSGLNKAGREMAIIIAWNAPPTYDPQNIQNKIYILGSSKVTVDKLDWEEVLFRLEESSFCWGLSNASIAHENPDTASVVVTFDLDNGSW